MAVGEAFDVCPSYVSQSDVAAAGTAARLVVVAVATLVLLFRAPLTFLAPQLWAEDGALFAAGYNMGWHALVEPLAGSLNLYGAAIAIIAGKLPPILAPWIEVYAAHAATLLVVWMAMSPRFQMPYRPIAALAIVCAAAGFEVLGVLASAQWILPLGLVVLLFSVPSKSHSVWALEMVFAAVVGLDGPVGIYLLPLFLWQLFLARGLPRTRLALLAAMLAVTSAVQIGYLYQDHLNAFSAIAPRPYARSLWLTMPVRWLDAAWPVNRLFGFGRRDIAGVVFGAAALCWFIWREPFRPQKLAMIVLAAAVLYSGMIKYRNDLQTVLDANGRYFFLGSVFFTWFLCIAAATARKMPCTVITVAALTLVNGALSLTIRPRPPVPWAVAAARIGHGPISIPTAPEGWTVDLSH